MKNTLKFYTAITVILSASSAAFASPEDQLREGNDPQAAIARHSAERYEEYKANNYQAPMGGYSEKFGDPAPLGTASPGMVTQKDYNGGVEMGKRSKSDPFGN